MYVETGDKEKAFENAQIVLTKEPKVQSTAIKEMREEAKIIEDSTILAVRRRKARPNGRLPTI